jgi:phosphosulfolactate phosphohydrolase-like enzyme
MNDKISIYDHLTGETIVREMTDEEQAERNAQVAAYLAEKEAKVQAAIQAAAKRQALLDKLGITEDEARLLLGGN